MPDIFRKKREIYLVSKRVNDQESVVGVASTFCSAYKVGCFDLAIAKPNLNERQARRKRKKESLVLIYNTLEFQSIEEAIFSPVGKTLKIEKVPILKS